MLRRGCRPRRMSLRSSGSSAGPAIEALRSSLPISVAPGIAPAWILMPKALSADLPPTMSSRALAETRCRPGVAMVESSLKKRSPLSVVSPAKTGRTIGGAMPSSRELRSSVSFRPAPCRATTTSPRAQTSGPAAKSSLASKLSSAPAPLKASFTGGRPGRFDEMSEDSARGLLGIDGERELVGGGHIGHDGLELARRVEALRGQAEIEALGGRPQGRLAVDLQGAPRRRRPARRGTAPASRIA